MAFNAPPCKDCAARHIGCHGTCPKYAVYDAGGQKYLDDTQKVKEATYQFYGMRKVPKARRA